VRHKERVQILGILNRTPDSFFDGGLYVDEQAARARVLQLVSEGADIVDLGAESTRPGAARVSSAEQIARLGELVEFTVAQGVAASVDTTSPEVAAYALGRGASMVNTVALGRAAELGAVAARFGARLVLTHCRGPMSEMSGFSVYAAGGYDDVVADVAREWRIEADRALAQGLAADRLVFDPGLGFTKNAAQSLELCARLGEFRALGHPILVGPSRKSYLAQAAAAVLGGEAAPPHDRLGSSIAAAVLCVQQGASMVRVHDVRATRQALAYAAALGAVQSERAARAARGIAEVGERGGASA
jgi:dihydropteroate synthase